MVTAGGVEDILVMVKDDDENLVKKYKRIGMKRA